MLLCFATHGASMRVGESREIKIFVDSSNLERGFPASITTNPSILSREEHGDYRQHTTKIIGLLDCRVLGERNIPSESIMGSIRHIHDVNDALIAGAHIVTVPPKFCQLVSHSQTDEAVQQFITDFQRWLG